MALYKNKVCIIAIYKRTVRVIRVWAYISINFIEGMEWKKIY